MKGKKPNITALNGALETVPRALAWMPKFAKAEWLRVVPTVVKARSLATHELSNVESYCVAGIRECEAVIQQDGLTYVSAAGDIRRRAETTLLKENIEAARRLAAELGLTPASRNKNKGGAVDDEDDEFAGLDI